ncbi:hypothetical protein KDA00_05040, partial [Candidatus Saccharibacteria bacterium]|nr:hypothetical protein [Candidatus Saccharibacteria bacterium]
MKKLLRKPTAYLSAVVVGLSSMLVFAVPSVHAASVLWDGEGGDNNFSTAANWSGDIVPSDGDDLVFRNDTISQSEIYTNDLTNFAPRSFSFQKGVATNYYSITIAGNDITITDGIYTEIPAVLDLNLTLNGDQTFTNAANTTQGSLTIGNQNATRDMNIGISNLTIHDDSSCAVVRIDSNVTGSGQINVTGSYNATVLSKSNSSYTGSINVGAGSYLEAQNAQSLGTTGTGTTVASGGSIGFASASGYTDNSYAEPLNISGTGGQYTGAIVATIPIIGTGCKGGVPDVNFTITLTGTITLQTDITASTWL